MSESIRWHSINETVVEALNHLADFADFNNLDFHIVLPDPRCAWWRMGGEYLAGITLRMDSPDSDAPFDRSNCRKSAFVPGIHFELPSDVDTTENRELLLHEGKSFLKAKTGLQVVTFGRLSRSEGWNQARGNYVISEHVELFASDFYVYATKAEIFQPTTPNEIHSVRGRALFF